MSTIETKEPKYIVGDIEIVRLEVSPIGFASFCAAGDAAGKLAKTDNDVQKNLFRERIKRQCKAYSADGKAIPLTDILILQMPIQYAMRLKSSINDDEDKDNPPKKCKMLSKGDGMLTPIHIELGSPIKGAAGAEIAELEFQASTLGQLEDFVAADSQMDKTLALLAIAKPVGPDMKLQALPSWAVDQLTLTDGAWLMSEVVPSFLHEPKAS